TYRLRKVINKGVTDEEILRGCAGILEAGWRTLKLYFMIGLPTETEADLDGIAALVHKILDLPRLRGRFQLNVSISPFVPKPNTPFQWERQSSREEIAGKERYLARKIRSRRVLLSQRDPRVSALEGILARGDRTLWPVLQEAHERGCRFDGWRDQLRFEVWEKVLADHGMSEAVLLEGFPVGSPLPWRNFGSPVRPAYLLAERKKAYAGSLTADCRTGVCSGCGACPGVPIILDSTGRAEREGGGSMEVPGEKGVEGGSSRPAGEENSDKISGPAGEKNLYKTGPAGENSFYPSGDGRSWSKDAAGEVFRYRFLYRKRDRIRFLSHREFINVLQRALRRSGLPLSFSRGFHPHARISMGPSLAVGMEGDTEFFDIELTRPVEADPGIFRGLLPEGITILDGAGPFTKKKGKLPPEALYRYLIDLSVIIRVLQPRSGDGRSSSNEKLPAGREDSRLPGAGEMWYLLGGALVAAGGQYLPGDKESTAGQEDAGDKYLFGENDPAGEKNLPGDKDATGETYSLKENDSSGKNFLTGEKNDSVKKDFIRDPAGWLEAGLVRAFEKEAVITDRRGRKRSCRGCRVGRRADSRDDSQADHRTDRRERESRIELLLPAHAEGSPGPKDILRSMMDGKLVNLVKIRRLEILYRIKDNYFKPLELIVGKE
ncbi:MAG: DUF2344 domain-containing protein, partial [Candidatus Krumholzibacteriota bacterium]|nr:DUF2344 domain-containing protein [Candidatus Krumholzibacteriota bacterium]